MNRYVAQFVLLAVGTATLDVAIAVPPPDPKRNLPQGESKVRLTTEGRGVPVADKLADRRSWWCFEPVSNPPLPAVRNASWSDHPIDRFILAKLDANGLVPSPVAEPQALVRRLSFALTGLPPTPDDVELFERAAMQDPQAALQQAADRLLASDRFGEHWARHWMDLVRYADTYGSEHDYLNPYTWRYRDYLIRAFNGDLPYDRFIVEQLAGDLVETPRWNTELGINESLLGTAYHRMIEFYATPVDVKREEAGVIDWQIETLGKAFQGLTIACARCHDHKFDPISTEDFYALYGVLASTRPAINIVDDPARLIRHDVELAQLKLEIARGLAAHWSAFIREWLGPLRAAKQRLVQAEPGDTWVEALRAAKQSPLAVVRTLATAPDFVVAWDAERAAAMGSLSESGNVELLADFRDGLPSGWRVSGPGLPVATTAPGLLSLAPGGDRLVRTLYPAGYFSDAVSERHGGSLRSREFVLRQRAVSVLASGSGKARLRLVIENFQGDLLLFSTVNPDLNSSSPQWVTMPLRDQWIGRRAHIEFMTRDDKPSVGTVKDVHEWSKTDGRSAFGVVRVVLHEGAAPAVTPRFPAEFWNARPQSWDELAEHFTELSARAVVSWGKGEADESQVSLLMALLDAGLLPNRADADPRLGELVKRFRELEAAIPIATRAPGVCDDGVGYDSPVFIRGDHRTPGPLAPRRWLTVLGAQPLGSEDSGRLQLAHEITRRDNPLTARVMANRIWQHLTGLGLVATPDNFGRMGAIPSHPELLDHLATRFMDDGWSVKRLIKYIVSSRTWQLSCVPSQEAARVDPDNLVLSHARLRRLEAESVRDAILAVAGNLRAGHEGAGTRLFYLTQIDPDKQPAPGPVDGDGCRSLFLEVRRNFLSEFLLSFDFPKPNLATGKRSETNVPAQSLAMLNDAFVLHQAERWGRRIAASAGSDEQRITRMYIEAFGRRPLESELQAALCFIHPASGAGSANEGDAAGWSELAHVLFNMKEFVYLR